MSISPEIYIGGNGLINVHSEVRLLEAITDHFEQNRQPALLLANFNAPSANVALRRQIDLVIVTQFKAVVVEAKGFVLPVRGTINGPWQQLLGNGEWRDFAGRANPYMQALDAKNAVTDALRELDRAAPYPSAALTFVPALPSGSSVPRGDFKVSIVTTAELLALIDERAGRSDFAKWRDLSTRLGLRRVRDVTEATDPIVMMRRDALRSYKEASRAYFTEARPLVPIPLERNGEDVSSDALLSADPISQSFLVGPSGCGKSLLQRHLAARVAKDDAMAILLAAKYFDGSLKRLLDASVRPFFNGKAATLLRHAADDGQRIIVFVDGCNECPASEKEAFARALAGIARIYPIVFNISGQTASDLPKLDGLPTYSVLPPDMETKRRIAEAAAGKALGDDATAELDAVYSGLDAEIYGATASQLPQLAGSFARFDAYCRVRFGGGANAIGPLDILVAVARSMTERLSMFISLSEFHRLASGASRNVEDAVRSIYASGIIDARPDRLSFRHELFYRFFMAESLARIATTSAAVRAVMAQPIFQDFRVLLIGAVAERSDIGEVLRNISDGRLLFECYQGACGAAPRRCAAALREEIINAIAEEAKGLQFGLSEMSSQTYCPMVDAETVRDWSEAERAAQALVGYTLHTEADVDRLLSIVMIADARLAEFFTELRPEAWARKIASLRSELFREMYVMPWGGDTGIKVVIEAACSWPRPKMIPGHAIIRRIVPSRTPGQLYFAAKLIWACGAIDPNELALHLLAMFGQPWRFLPHHLRLELLHALGLCQEASDETKRKVKPALEALLTDNPWWNSIVVDALHFVGAFDDEGDSVGIAEQIKDLVNGPDGEDERSVLAGIFSAQMDHPHAHAHSEAIASLEPAVKARFLNRAALGLGLDPDPISLGVLMDDIVMANSPECEPALRKWAMSLPVKSALYDPPGRVMVLLLAHVGLARLALPLDATEGLKESTGAKALRACGEIVYWTCQPDLDDVAIVKGCERALHLLTRHELGVGASAFMLMDRALSGTMAQLMIEGRTETLWMSISSRFSKQIADVSRQALRRPNLQHSYFTELYRDHKWRDNDNDWRRFAIDILGNFGTTDDIDLLKAFANDPNLTKSAMGAITSLER